jgi:hypothetical protein
VLLFVFRFFAQPGKKTTHKELKIAAKRKSDQTHAGTIV